MKLNEIKLSKFQPKAWGYHLIVNCSKCKSDAILDEDKLKKFISELVDEIKMKAVGDPLVKHFPQRDPGKDGFSLVQLIETSSITCHCVDKSKNAYIDIFSCKEFSYEDACSYINKVLKPEHMSIDFLTRDA